MIINSVLPPTSFQSVIDNQWYIVTTDPKLGWVEVDRQYNWDELNKMWSKVTYKTAEVQTLKKTQKVSVKKTYNVEGSKGNRYTIVNDGSIWNCSCPAHGFGRGKDCKHIKQIKNEKHA
jgi:hypothetical protein